MTLKELREVIRTKRLRVKHIAARGGIGVHMVSRILNGHVIPESGTWQRLVDAVNTLPAEGAMDSRYAGVGLRQRLAGRGVTARVAIRESGLPMDIVYAALSGRVEIGERHRKKLDSYLANGKARKSPQPR